MHRLLPLASLLELSLGFPDQTPSRFGLALRTGSTKKLARTVEEVKKYRVSTNEGLGARQALALVAALKDHEPLTRGHTERVRAYADLIGEEMGLSKDERQRLQWGVLLHDVGKLTVPAELLSKDGKPTPEEWEIIRGHPGAGAMILEPMRSWLGDFVDAAAQHHERFDGTGYPGGLAGEQISLSGRIAAVADAYDVITSARSYKKPFSPEHARRELVASAFYACRSVDSLRCRLGSDGSSTFPPSCDPSPPPQQALRLPQLPLSRHPLHCRPSQPRSPSFSPHP